MDPLWIQLAGQLTLSLYLIVIAAAVTGLVVLVILRKIAWRSDAGPLRSWRIDGRLDPPGSLMRAFVEYVGNTNEHEASTSGISDRRRNREARLLMDHVRADALERAISPSDVETLVEKLRQAIRAEEPVD